MFRFLIVANFLLWGITLSPSFSLHANTILVDCEGEGDYLTIQEGIYAAVDGDTVLVSPCLYQESVSYNQKEIMVKSLQGPQVTIIQGTSSWYPVVHIAGVWDNELDTTVVLEGFTLIAAPTGDGIMVQRADPKIIGNIIRNAMNGIFTFSGGNAIIRSNVFYENVICILLSSSYSRELTGNIFFLSGTGDGIVLDHMSTHFTVENNVILGVSRNYSISYGIDINDCNPTVKNNLIIGDYAGRYPILLGITPATYPSDAIIKNNIVTGTEAYGLNVGAGDPLIENNIITRGRDTGVFFRQRDYANPLLVNNIITENEGYGIDCYTGFSGEMLYNDVWGNRGGDYSGDCWVGEGDISQDPLFVDAEKWHFSLQPLSPAIDVGDPSILDTDGTRSDMGSYGGLWAEPVNLSMYTPSSFNISRGDTLHVEAIVSNNTAFQQEVLFLVNLFVATGYPYPRNPITGPVPLSLNPRETVLPYLEFDYHVSAGIPTGLYRLEGVVQDSSGVEIDKEYLFLMVN